MQNLEKIFNDVKRDTASEKKQKKNSTSVKKSVFVVLGLFFVMSAMLPAVSAQQVWVSDRTDPAGDHVVAVATQNPIQRDPSNARAFIKVEVHYTEHIQWYGVDYLLPTNIDLRIYMDKGTQYIYTSSDGSGHGWASDAWSNPHDSWNVGGTTVGFAGRSITLPNFYSVDNIMLNQPKNNPHYSTTGDVEWYYTMYDASSVITAYLHQEKWFGGEQDYYIMGGHGQHINYHFRSAVYYQHINVAWNGWLIPGSTYTYVSYIYAKDDANIVIQ